MRDIIFDTETTGLESKQDRIIEIGGVELINNFPSGKTIHIFINPGDRKVHPDALAVHGITDEFLKDKPSFAEVAQQIVDFFEGARWIAHNANFDMGFINAEFERIGLPPVPSDQVVDTLAMARRKHPMGPNSLDALCRRYGIDNTHRTKHGALLDSELLAEVYIEMNGGRQAALGLVGSDQVVEVAEAEETVFITDQVRPRALANRLSAKDLEHHASMIASMKGKAIWLKYRQE
ncbi:DNA polymerase III subunit epsilon [Aliirhizobium cellulosilyticum]|uniref:DNA polymerase III subunit epsilon n=1 Tax=Aliirhizobium cellulosilyticum TaxID=393664 RepID=A0A7W6TLD7_9HYPH|nr:DNA polymerase III subunit epsilon [Rhizobium cellulosilyticum]MBB4351458.1 DNA polymerase-3 subunit epsilon [Rhizobium cellulosilyticum]MBB4414651.1 DNA polymerase-3 subunit epsilon [Rhizobium cellulosilyticum]MBB4449267.1 DNA polymerase-3 subunit epsilon [Rhizobium cellulosilyticum]